MWVWNHNIWKPCPDMAPPKSPLKIKFRIDTRLTDLRWPIEDSDKVQNFIWGFRTSKEDSHTTHSTLYVLCVYLAFYIQK